ncbi:SSPO-like protein [Mya arenaria]|uniref:SSPO-like protein n=1 Tax=Mya arenaria TaxID=6604 RepID=A0ABY7G1P1_MYAAR|nr:SSPO-like protein [Mya arenaria]
MERRKTPDARQCKTCQDSKWQTEMADECPGICSATGESSFSTFDGKMFSFSDTCEYTMLVVGDTSVTQQNVPCGSGGMRLHLFLDEAYANQVAGLCGNFDGSNTNDFKLKDGSTTGNPHGKICGLMGYVTRMPKPNTVED